MRDIMADDVELEDVAHDAGGKPVAGTCHANMVSKHQACANSAENLHRISSQQGLDASLAPFKCRLVAQTTKVHRKPRHICVRQILQRTKPCVQNPALQQGDVSTINQHDPPVAYRNEFLCVLRTVCLRLVERTPPVGNYETNSSKQCDPCDKVVTLTVDLSIPHRRPSQQSCPVPGVRCAPHYYAAGQQNTKCARHGGLNTSKRQLTTKNNTHQFETDTSQIHGPQPRETLRSVREFLQFWLRSLPSVLMNTPPVNTLEFELGTGKLKKLHVHVIST